MSKQNGKAAFDANKRRDKVFSYGLLALGLLFYLFFAFYDGVEICVDSPSYINMSVTREALYPSILAISRLIFGDGELYLFVVVVLQSILAGFAAWILEEYLRKEIAVPKWVSVIIMALPLAVSYLCRFAAQRASMYSNDIMTEGIAIAMYLMAIRYIYEYLLYQTRRSLIIATVLAGIMFSTRKQMLVVLALIMVVILWLAVAQTVIKKKTTKSINRSIRKNKEKVQNEILNSDTQEVKLKYQNVWGKAILRVAIVCAAVFLGSSIYDRAYNYIVRGEIVGHSSDNRFIATMIFYTADEDSAGYIEDQEVGNLFWDIYSVCEEKGYVGSAADSGWYNEVTHFGDYYDCIQIDTMWPMIHDYVNGKNAELVGVGNSMNREIETDRIMNVMIKALLPRQAMKILHVLFNNFLSGLVTTVAQRTPVLIWYSVIAYLGYIALLIYNLSVNKLSKANLFALLVLVSIIGNVTLVSAVIFCQTRYTIYNMALFYIAGLLLFHEVSATFMNSKK